MQNPYTKDRHHLVFAHVERQMREGVEGTGERMIVKKSEYV